LHWQQVAYTVMANEIREEYPPTLSGLVIIAYTANAASIILALYIFFWIVGLRLGKLKTNSHYRLRLAIAFLLLSSRIFNILVVFYAMYLDPMLTEWIQFKLSGKYLLRQAIDVKKAPLETILSIVTFVFRLCSMFLVLTILLLTINRYRRINMVLPRSKQDYFLLGSIGLCCVALFASFSFYIIKYLVMLDKDLYERTKPIRYIWELGGSIEAFATLYGMILYYALTIQLVLEFSRKDGSTSLIKILLILPTRICSRKRHDPARPHQTLTAEARNLLVLKMMGYFITIFLTDVAIIVMTILGTQGSDLNFVCYQAIGYSWLSLHIYCLLALFGIFLNSLNHANQVQRFNRERSTQGDETEFSNLTDHPNRTNNGNMPTPSMIQDHHYTITRAPTEESSKAYVASFSMQKISTNQENSLFHNI
jgi:hypothetical protein